MFWICILLVRGEISLILVLVGSKLSVDSVLE